MADKKVRCASCLKMVSTGHDHSCYGAGASQGQDSEADMAEQEILCVDTEWPVCPWCGKRFGRVRSFNGRNTCRYCGKVSECEEKRSYTTRKAEGPEGGKP